MSEDDRKQLVKRSPEVTKTYTPPYTSLRQKEGERVRVTKKSQQWQQQAYSELDAYIESELKKQNITKKMLQENPSLRRQVTEWKRQVYAGVKQSLDDYQKQLDAIVGTDKFTFADIEEQNRKFKEAYDSGQITAEQYSLAVAQQNANIVAEQKQAMREAGWGGTWEGFVKNLEDRQTAVNSAISSGLVKRDGNNIVISKSPSEWTDADVKVYNEIGFNIQKPTSEFSPNQIYSQNEQFKKAYDSGKITAEQYNEALYQQNLNLQATYNEYEAKGLITKKFMSGPVKPGEERSFVYELAKNYYEYTPSEQKTLKGMFDITQTMQDRANVIQSLISSGAIREINGELVQNKPYLQLNETEARNMAQVGFDIPSWETISKAQSLSGEGFVENIPFGFAATTGQIAKDTTGLINWLTKDADIFGLIPDTDIKFSGVSLDSLTKWVKLNPTAGEQAFLISANVALAVAEGVALDAVLMAGVTGAAKTAGKVGNFVVSKTGIAKVASYIASNKTLVSAVSKISSFKGKATLANIGKWLTAHPNITAMLIAAPICGMQITEAVGQLQAGRKPYDVMIDLGRNLGFVTGGLLYNKIYTDYQRKALQEMVQQRMTKIDAVHTNKGWQLQFTVKDWKSIPKKYVGLFETAFDPESGKIILTGWGRAEGVQFPMALEFTAQQWDDIAKNLKFGPEALKGALLKYIKPEEYYLLLNKYPEIAKMSPDKLFDILANYKSVITTGMSPDEISDVISSFSKLNRNIKPESMIKIMNDHPELAKYIQSHMDEVASIVDDIGRVSDKKLLDILYKEIGDRGPWVQGLQVKTVQLAGTESFSMDLMAAYIREDGVDIITKMRETFTSFGIDKAKSARLTAQILTDDLGMVSSALETLKLTENQVATIMALRYEAGGPNMAVSYVYRALKQGGLSSDEATDVIELYAKAKGSVTGLDLQKLGGKFSSLSNDGLSAIVDMLSPNYITSLRPAPELLNRFVEVMTHSTASTFITTLSTEAIVGLGTKALTNSMIEMETADLNKTINRFSPDELSKIVPKIDLKLLESMVPKLSTVQIPMVFSALSQSQLDDIVSRLSTDQVERVMQSLNVPPPLLQRYLQTGFMGRVENLTPFLLRRVIDEHLKRSKEAERGKPRYFEVRLFHNISSEIFKIKAITFKEATHLALQRRKVKEVPIEVTVREVSGQ